MDRYSYELIEHTADAGIRVRGESLAELFSAAAYAMFDFMIDLRNVQSEPREEVLVEAPDREALLLEWLSELLFAFEVRGLVGRAFEVEEISEQRILARVRGEAFDPERHAVLCPIKAITFHGLRLAETEDGYEATVIFDL